MLLSLLLASQVDAKDPVMRLERMLASAKSLSVKFDFYRKGWGNGEGQLVWQRPNKMFFKVSLGGRDYSLYASDGQVLELNNGFKLYNDTMTGGVMNPQFTSISPLPTFMFPKVAVYGLRALLGPGQKFTQSGKTTINGQSGDLLTMTSAIRGDRVHYKAVVGEDGKIWLLDRVAEKGGYDYEGRFEFRDYQINPTLPPETFRASVPNGYMPFSLPPANLPIQVGRKLSLGKWTSSTGEEIDLDSQTAGKPALFVLVRSECPASEKLMGSLDSWRSMLKGAGGQVVVLSDEQGLRGVDFTDGGRSETIFTPPGTPLMVLRNGQGTVTHVWLGYNPGKTRVYMAELKEALQELATE